MSKEGPVSLLPLLLHRHTLQETKKVAFFFSLKTQNEKIFFEIEGLC